MENKTIKINSEDILKNCKPLLNDYEKGANDNQKRYEKELNDYNEAIEKEKIGSMN